MRNYRICVVLAFACALPAQVPADHVPATAFTAPEGLEVTLWAKSPMLRNPTNLDIDQHGRIWVTEGVNYRGKAKREPAGDRVVVLTDSDGDGRADNSQVFVQAPELVSPLGIAVFDNVVVVSQPPNLLVYTDTNRNLRFEPEVDTREVLLTGFQGKNHDHSLHSVTAGPDGRWYWNSGNCGAVFTDRSNRTFRITSSYMDPQGVAGSRSDDGHVWIGGFAARMQPDGSQVEILGHNFRNSYEQVITSFGDVFQSDNDDPPASRVAHVIQHASAGFASRDGKRTWQADRRRGQSVAVAEWRQQDPGTMPAGDVYGGGSPTGVAFYENGALGDRWPGLLLACEPGRNTVFGYFPKRQGAGFQLERFDWLTTNAQHEFAGSDFTGGRWDGRLHTQFRPSDVCIGPDGAVYVADWFDGRVGGHQTLDDTLGGAIYRIAPKGFEPRIPTFDFNTPPGAALAVCSPAANVRFLGQRAIRSGGANMSRAVKQVEQHANPFVRARAIWLTSSEGAERPASNGSADTRLATLRALLAAGRPPEEVASAYCRDADPAVRAAAATSLFAAPPSERVIASLVAIGGAFDGKDRSYLEAFGIGCTNKEERVYAQLFATAKSPPPPTEWTEAQAWIAWRLSAVAAVPGLVARTRAETLPADARQRMLTGLAFVRDRSAADAMLDLAADTTYALRSDALWWCLRRMGSSWSDFEVRTGLLARGLYDPDSVAIQAVSLPPAPEEPLGFAVGDVLKLEGKPAAGRLRAGSCYLCHQIEGRGVPFGPDLTSFGRSQSRRAIAEAILNPSKSISHGYAGHTVETDAGSIIGIVLSRQDPVMVQSQGGVVQMIPKERVRSIRALQRSLMWEPQTLGLDAQGTADLVAYLQSIRQR
ncbi:MAG: PVC-type heme-binding CxxCH protein [Planctomycetota bacterium]